MNDILEGRNREIRIGKYGIVGLIDTMPRLVESGETLDHAVIQAARTSYGQQHDKKADAENRGLIRYLFRKNHVTPFEMVNVKWFHRLPIFVARQLIRHRTACLSGDTEVVFERPCDGKAYRMQVADVYKKWQPTAGLQGNATFRREQVQSMRLRCVNEETGEPAITQVVDIWQSGVKRLFKVTTEKGRSIRTSEDHLFFTPSGWKKLSDLSNGCEVVTLSYRQGIPTAVFNAIDPETETWCSLVDWDGYYEVSNQGRVRRIVGGRGSRSFGRCKKITVSNERAVVSLNCPGIQATIQIHREMLRSFVGEPENDDIEACHVNGNSLDNRLENLYWGTRAENAHDMVVHGRATFLTSQPQTITIEPDGEEMTYDLEVSGQWHNFSANDFIVHNSVNEFSMRYKEPKDYFFIPDLDGVRRQSKINKQGSDGAVDEGEAGAFISVTQQTSIDAMINYRAAVAHGIGKELARINLPVSVFTEWYWELDLNNLLRFLALRMDKHAQKEIRVYADAMYELLSPLAPWSFEAFNDFSEYRGALKLSRLEVETLLTMIEDFKKDGPEASVSVKLSDLATKGEQDEWREKRQMLGLP